MKYNQLLFLYLSAKKDSKQAQSSKRKESHFIGLFAVYHNLSLNSCVTFNSSIQESN